MPGPVRRRTAAVTFAAGSLALAFAVPASAGSPPPAPSSLTAVTRGAGFFLKWQSTAKRFLVQQATNRSFTAGTTSYPMRQPGHVFTPFRVSAGGTYYFRVRAVNSSGRSAPSNVVSVASAPRLSGIRVLSYNSLAAHQAGASRPGGTVAPWSDRRGPQLDLIRQADADVVGMQEGSNCLYKLKGQPCFRQIDDIASRLDTRYTLVDTSSTASGTNRYGNAYILYASTVRPVGRAGTWLLGPSDDQHYAAYQAFRVVSTGATFLFVDAHLIAARGTTYDRIRGSETKRMLDQATTYASNNGYRSIVYVGDFNTYYNEWHVDDLSGDAMRAAGVPDGVAVAANRSRVRFDSNNELYRHARHGHGSIDHVYAGGGVGVKRWGELLNLDSSNDFIGTIPSDHNPVYADLTIPS